MRAFVQLREFILAQQSRFRPEDDENAIVRDLVAYTASIQNVKAYLFTDLGFSEATKGFTAKAVLEDLRLKGYLFHEKNRLKKRCSSWCDGPDTVVRH